MHSSKQVSLSRVLSASFKISHECTVQKHFLRCDGSLRAEMLTANCTIEKRRYTVLDAPGRSPFIFRFSMFTTTFKFKQLRPAGFAATI